MATMSVEEDPLSLAWSWVVETLADTKQVDTPLLDDLVSRVPNGYDSLSNITKERVALRRLEDMFGTPNPNDVDAAIDPALSQYRLCADVAEPAQDVYCRLRGKEMDASGARAAHQFILRRRAQLPKCGLQELEELLTDGSNPIAENLRKASGLTMEQVEDCTREPGQTRTPEADSTRVILENLDDVVQDHHRAESPISTANVVMEMQTDFTRFVSENLDNMVQDEFGSKSLNSARIINMEMQVDSTHLVSENLDNPVQGDCSAKTPDSTTMIDMELQEDSTRLVSEKRANLGQDDCGAKSSNSTTKVDVEKQPDVNCLVYDNLENHVIDDAKTKSPVSTTKIDMERVQADSTRLVSENLENLVQEDCRPESPNSATNINMEMQVDSTSLVSENLDKQAEVQEDSTCLVSENRANLGKDDCGVKFPNSTTKVDMEIIQADSTRLVSKNPDNCVQEDCGAESPNSIMKGDVEKPLDSTQLVSKSLANLVQEECRVQSPNSTTKMDMEIIQADSTHLVPENLENLVQPNYSARSLQYSTDIYMEMVSVDGDSIEIDMSEFNYCIKCKKRGKLLICSGNTCRIAVHRSCLNCEPSFDGMGNFHCPICSNLQASIVLELKKKTFERAKEKVMLAKARLDRYNTRKAEIEAPKRK